jgi:hypothetical protein
MPKFHHIEADERGAREHADGGKQRWHSQYPPTDLELCA